MLMYLYWIVEIFFVVLSVLKERDWYFECMILNLNVGVWMWVIFCY